MAGRGSALVIGLLSLAFFSAIAMPPAAAQSASGNASDACAQAEQVDANTELCSADLEGGDAVLTFRSSSSQVVTIWDAGAFADGGEPPSRDVRLEANETTTVRFPVSETDGGKAGVGISTDRTVYSVILKEQRFLLGGPWTAQDARVAALFAALSSAFVAAVTVLRRRRGDGGEPRAIA